MIYRLRKLRTVLLSAVVIMLAGTVAAAAGYILGDADSSGDVSIVDASCIQRTLAGLPLTCEFSEQAADVDGSGELEITDATFIQRLIADIDTPYPIGELITEPTAAPTQWATDEEGWGSTIFRP